MNDAELVKQVINGNSNAFRYLVARYQRLVVHIVGRIVQQQQDIEDICQEVFIKVYRKMKHFRGDARLSTWIAKIAYNTSITYVKRQRGKELSFDEHPVLVSTKEDSSFNLRALEREEAKKYLLQAIEKLPVQYRSLLTLFHLEEFSYREIEKITEMPEGTIKSYLSRARKMLKEQLKTWSEKEKTNIFTDYA
ncbi:MAG: RNA polymerase subunit sigma-24 [Draconibacterium sp.]|nr:MAG: RNA polymerase subunit sigma-24 [Draconibacterium sp.]